MIYLPNRRADRITLLLSAFLFALGFFHPWFHERVPDDAFYYFQVARNIAETGRSTFDGVTLATGYHPLWMGIAVALYFIFGAALPYALLVVAFILFVIYALTVLRMLEQLEIDGVNGLLFKFLFIANPVFLTMGWSNGLETAPVMLCVVLLMQQCLLRLGGKGGNSTTAAIACAFAFLSRLDSILFAFPCYVWAFRRDLRRNPFPAAIPVLTVIGFVCIHHLLFGAFVPSSADAMRFSLYPTYLSAHRVVFHTGYYVDAPAHLQWFARNSAEIISTLAGQSSRLFGSTLIAKIVAISIAFVVAVEVLRQRLVSATGPRKTSRVEYSKRDAVVLTAAILFAAYVTTIRSLNFRPWYYPPLALAMGGAVVAYWKSGNLRASPILVTAVVFGMAISAVSDICQRWQPGNPWSGQVAVKNTLATLPSNITVGSFNAGVYGWAAPNRIINLDGLVNDQAFAAIKHHNLDRYMVGADIHYILDRDDPQAIRLGLESRISPGTPFNLELIEAWPDGNPHCAHHLYRLDFPPDEDRRKIIGRRK